MDSFRSGLLQPMEHVVERRPARIRLSMVAGAFAAVAVPPAHGTQATAVRCAQRREGQLDPHGVADHLLEVEEPLGREGVVVGVLVGLRREQLVDLDRERGIELPQAPGAPRSAEASAYGALSIRVQPAEADVLIDGEKWRGPEAQDRLIVEVAEGRHTVEVQKTGYRSYMTEVQVRRGDTTTINVSLRTQNEQ